MNTKTEPSKIAILGAGWVVREIWLPALLKDNLFHVIGLYDTDESALALTLERYPFLKGYNVDEMLFSNKPNVVLIATPNKYHIEYAQKFLNENISVIVEKPICLSVAEFRKLEEAVNKSQASFIPSAVNKFRTDVNCLFKLFNSVNLGTLKNIKLRWIRASGIPKLGGWFTNKALAGGGVAYDLGWHMLDIGLSLLNYPEILHASGMKFTDFIKRDSQHIANWRSDKLDGHQLDIDVEDQFVGFIITSDNVTINLEVAWVSHVATDFTEIIVNSENAILRLFTTFGLSPNRVDTPSLTIMRHGEKENIIMPENKLGSEYERQVNYIANIINNKTISSKNLTGVYSVIKALELMYNTVC